MQLSGPCTSLLGRPGPGPRGPAALAPAEMAKRARGGGSPLLLGEESPRLRPLLASPWSSLTQKSEEQRPQDGVPRRGAASPHLEMTAIPLGEAWKGGTPRRQRPRPGTQASRGSRVAEPRPVRARRASGAAGELPELSSSSCFLLFSPEHGSIYTGGAPALPARGGASLPGCVGTVGTEVPGGAGREGV